MFSGVGGYAARAVQSPFGWHEQCYRTASIHRKSYLGVPDCYCSMNTFFPRGREVRRGHEQLKRLNTLYLDLDYYKLGLSRDHVLRHLCEDHYDRTMPRPTFTIDSGRGLYLVWRFSPDEDRNAYPRWKRAMDYLVSVTAEFGVDTACAEPSRVLRVPGTVNSRVGKTVEILDFCPAEYTLRGILTDYDVKKDGGGATAKMIRFASDIAKAKGLDAPDAASFSATRDFIAQNKEGVEYPRNRFSGAKTGVENEVLYAGRARDIERLVLSRTGADCKREIALFLYRYYCFALTGDEADALEKTLSLNSRLSCPLPPGECASRTKSAVTKQQRGGSYRYTTQKIISDLEITPEEQARLRYLCGAAASAAERRKASNRRHYEKRRAAQGKIPKTEQIAARREETQRLDAFGMSPEDIAKTTGVSKRTVQGDLAAMSARGAADALDMAAEPAEPPKAAQNAPRSAEGAVAAACPEPRGLSFPQAPAQKNKTLYYLTSLKSAPPQSGLTAKPPP
jgi:hypothetical protein